MESLLGDSEQIVVEPSLGDSKKVVVEPPSREREDSSLGAVLIICSESEFVHGISMDLQVV